MANAGIAQYHSNMRRVRSELHLDWNEARRYLQSHSWSASKLPKVLPPATNGQIPVPEVTGIKQADLKAVAADLASLKAIGTPEYIEELLEIYKAAK